MRLSNEQLSSNLQRNGLLPIYLIGGDEPLQAMEASDLVRQYAREAGADRSVLIVETGFDWGLLRQENANMGLFSSSTLIELRMAHQTPGGRDFLRGGIVCRQGHLWPGQPGRWHWHRLDRLSA